MVSGILERLKRKEVKFADVIGLIDAHYTHVPTAFENGAQKNGSTENQGSAKVFAFAQLNRLDKEQTLLLFAEHYEAVLAAPESSDHQNIRQFMLHGWEGITFQGTALTAKQA